MSVTQNRGAAALFAVVRWLTITAFAVMVGAAIVQVISRYVFNSPLGWTEELARILMIWWTFAAIGILAFRRKLLAVDAVLLVARGRARQAVLALGNGLGLAAVGWLAWLSWRLVGLAGTQVSPALEIPQAWIYLGAALGLTAAAVGFAACLWSDLRRLARNEDSGPIKATERSDV
jgi:TRAP-type C4-dicarboxylate transport system permease small subunit